MKTAILALMLLVFTLSVYAFPIAYAADIKPALINTFGNEGGFQKDVNDSGNYVNGFLVGTKYGIAAASYPHEDIVNMSIEKASEIYKRDFWGASRCDEWKSQIIANDYFDAAVNIGQGTAARIMQRAINYASFPLPRIAIDGKIGKVTVQRLNEADQSAVYVNMIGLLHNRYVQIVDANPRKQRYMREWTNRVKRNVQRSVRAYEVKNHVR